MVLLKRGDVYDHPNFTTTDRKPGPKNVYAKLHVNCGKEAIAKVRLNISVFEHF